MIPSGEWLTPTRAIGIAAYAVAASCSAIACARARGLQTVSKLAASLTALEFGLLIDMIVNGRWMLHDMLENIARRRHEYDLRRLPQSILVAILVGALFTGLLFTLRRCRARIGALLAVSGILLSLVSWCIEVVSLHQVDAILYHPVGKLMAISFVWLLACMMTSIGILIDLHQSNSTA
jgi:hypothetical protein